MYRLMSKLLVPFIISICAIAIFPLIAMAQSPIEQCLIPFPEYEYEPFLGYSDVVHPTTGWTCGPVGGLSDCYGKDDQYGLRTYVANTYITRDGLLGTSHPPLRIDISTGGAFIDVYVGGAQLGQFTAGPFQTYSITVAQGIVYTDQIKIVVGGDADISEITITALPFDVIPKTNDILIDPNSQGINWPTWKIFTTTNKYIDYGSREVDGGLIIDDDTHLNYNFCTPIRIDSRLGHTDIITASFDKVSQTTQVGARFKIVDSLENIDIGAISDLYIIATAGRYTVTVPVAITPSLQYFARDAFLCLYVESIGNANINLNNFNATTCQQTPPVPCATINDNQFELDYDTLYQSAPLTIAPIPPNHWVYPTITTTTIFYNKPPVVVGVGESSELQLKAFQTVGHALAITSAYVYQVNFSANAVGPGGINYRALEVGLVNNYADIAVLNKYPITGTQLVNYISKTIEISKSLGLLTYTTFITAADIVTPILILRVPPYTFDTDDYIAIDDICAYPWGSTFTCTTIPNFMQGWTTNISATISLSHNLQMITGGVASQTLATTATTTHTAPQLLIVKIISASISNSLQINLGFSNTTIINNLSPGLFQLNIGIIQPFNLIKIVDLSGYFNIEFICLHDISLLPVDGNCLNSILPNGTFETDAMWTFQGGALHNDVAKSAWAPYVTGGTFQNQNIANFGQFLAGPPPALGNNQYLILSFDAWTITGNPGQATAIFFNNQLNNTIAITYSYEVGKIAKYQTDFSLFSGDQSDVGIWFVNSSYQISSTADMQIDNVCLFISSEPYTTTPQPYTNTLDIGPTCSTVTAWLSDTVGVNLPALENAPLPSLWDPSEWVPWLGAKLWFWLGKPLACLLIALVHDYLGLRVLNWIHWTIAQSKILLLFWVKYWQYSWDLVQWFSKMITLYVVSGALWLLDLLISVAKWTVADVTESGLDSLNYLLLAWNTLSPYISQMFTDMINVFVDLWNNYLAPFFSKFSILGDLWGLLLNIIVKIWELVKELFWLFLTLLKMMWKFTIELVVLPGRLYHAIMDAFYDSGYDIFPNCTADPLPNTCLLIAAIVLFANGTDDFGYPIVITLIIMATFFFFWRNVFSFVRGVVNAAD